MALATANHDNRRHGRLSHANPLSQEPAAEDGCVHSVICLKSGATVDELMGPTLANNIMTAATHNFSTLKWPALTQMTSAQIGQSNGHNLVKHIFKWESFW